MLFEGPFDSDEASDAVAEIEERDDVAAAMAEVLRDFVQDSEEYAEEGCGSLSGDHLPGRGPDFRDRPRRGGLSLAG